MLSHDRIWDAIDELALRHRLSPSGLARRAGLDPTTFNPSKRTSPDGRERWPSTESISKILEATRTTLQDFSRLVEPEPPSATDRSLPLLGFAQAGHGGFFDDGGHPAGAAWDQVDFPPAANGPLYALEISGDSMLPLYRDGDIIIVAPGEGVRRGDRVVVRTNAGEVMAKILFRRTPKTVELHSLNADHGPRALPAEEIDWIARIVWASQ
jgi:phage repressor protein C with HTH and peptisase S24 domain